MFSRPDGLLPAEQERQRVHHHLAERQPGVALLVNRTARHRRLLLQRRGRRECRAAPAPACLPITLRPGGRAERRRSVGDAARADTCCSPRGVAFRAPATRDNVTVTASRGSRSTSRQEPTDTAAGAARRATVAAPQGATGGGAAPARRHRHLRRPAARRGGGHRAVPRRVVRGGAGIAGRRRPAARGPVLQPGAELAGLQRPGAGAGRGHGPATAGAGEVPGDLRLEPRRVLHGPGRRPETPPGHGPVGDQRRRPDRVRAAGADLRPHPGTGRPAGPLLHRRHHAGAGRGRDPDRALGSRSTRRTGSGWPTTSPRRSSRCSPRSRSTRRTRSRTSPG